MKKTTILFWIWILISLFFTHCKSHEQNTTKEELNVDSHEVHDTGLKEPLPLESCIVDAEIFFTDSQTLLKIQKIYECKESSSRYNLKQKDIYSTSISGFSLDSGKTYRILIMVPTETTHTEILKVLH